MNNTAETKILSEPTEVQLRGYFNSLSERFVGQSPVLQEIGDGNKPDLSKLPSPNLLIEECAKATGFGTIDSFGGIFGWGEPVDQHAGNEADRIWITFGRVEESPTVRVVFSRCFLDINGNVGRSEPRTMFYYYPGSKKGDGDKGIWPSGFELSHFSRTENGMYIASVKQVYREINK